MKKQNLISLLIVALPAIVSLLAYNMLPEHPYTHASGGGGLEVTRSVFVLLLAFSGIAFYFAALDISMRLPYFLTPFTYRLIFSLLMAIACLSVVWANVYPK